MSWKTTANFFLELMLFLLGVYGRAAFLWLHREIAQCNAHLFGATCILCAAIILIILKQKVK